MLVSIQLIFSHRDHSFLSSHVPKFVCCKKKCIARGANLLLNKEESLCVLMKSCRVTQFLFSPPQIFFISPSLLIFPPLLLLLLASPQFLPLCLLPPVFGRWGGHVLAASVAAPGLDGLRASHTPEGRLRAAHFPSRGAKGPLEQRRGEEKWLLQPGVGPPSCAANQKPGLGRASWLLGCATNPREARPSSGTMALTKSTGRIVLLSRGSWQAKNSMDPSSGEVYPLCRGPDPTLQPGEFGHATPRFEYFQLHLHHHEHSVDLPFLFVFSCVRSP